jgi:hypothetical protein
MITSPADRLRQARKVVLQTADRIRAEQKRQTAILGPLRMKRQRTGLRDASAPDSLGAPFETSSPR